MAIPVKYNSKMKKYTAVVGKQLIVSPKLSAVCADVQKLGKYPRITRAAQKAHKESM